MEAYAKEFSLWEHIRFETEVVSVEKANDWDETGCWVVTVRDLDGDEKTHRFGSVLVCNGPVAKPNRIRVPGQESFEGRVLHSIDYRDGQTFKGRRVLVYGAGNTAGDIAVDLCNYASQVCTVRVCVCTRVVHCN